MLRQRNDTAKIEYSLDRSTWCRNMECAQHSLSQIDWYFLKNPKESLTSALSIPAARYFANISAAGNEAEMRLLFIYIVAK